MPSSRAVRTTGANIFSDSPRLRLRFAWEKPSEAAAKIAISCTPAATAASMPLALGTSTG